MKVLFKTLFSLLMIVLLAKTGAADTRDYGGNGSIHFPFWYTYFHTASGTGYKVKFRYQSYPSDVVDYRDSSGNTTSQTAATTIVRESTYEKAEQICLTTTLPQFVTAIDYNHSGFAREQETITTDTLGTCGWERTQQSLIASDSAFADIANPAGPVAQPPVWLVQSLQTDTTVDLSFLACGNGVNGTFSSVRTNFRPQLALPQVIKHYGCSADFDLDYTNDSWGYECNDEDPNTGIVDSFCFGGSFSGYGGGTAINWNQAGLPNYSGTIPNFFWSILDIGEIHGWAFYGTPGPTFPADPPWTPHELTKEITFV